MNAPTFRCSVPYRLTSLSRIPIQPEQRYGIDCFCKSAQASAWSLHFSRIRLRKVAKLTKSSRKSGKENAPPVRSIKPVRVGVDVDDEFEEEGDSFGGMRGIPLVASTN